MRNLKKVQHPDNSFYAYVYGRVFNNGAQEFGFLPSNANPLFSFRGAGRTVGGMRALQPAPLEMRDKRVTLAGIPTVAGQLFSQPLISSLDSLDGEE